MRKITFSDEIDFMSCLELSGKNKLQITVRWTAGQLLTPAN